jgi:hypothetical protein
VSSVRAQANRITAPIDLARVVPLNANLRPATLRKNDRGSVEEDFPLPAMTLFFKRSAGQQADLRQLLEDQQNPASPLYHRWLTPEMFGDRFGLSADDSAAMANWLRSQGFVVNQAARSGTWIAFSGTARQIQGGFIPKFIITFSTARATSQMRLSLLFPRRWRKSFRACTDWTICRRSRLRHA